MIRCLNRTLFSFYMLVNMKSIQVKVHNRNMYGTSVDTVEHCWAQSMSLRLQIII